MRIAMIGTGYVGLVSGACFADFGHHVTCVDKDETKISNLRKGKMPIWEPGLEALVLHNANAGRLSFTTDLTEALEGAEAVFIAVGTPARRGDGHADLSYVYAAAKEIAETLTGPAVVVTKSTVPVGTGDEIEKILTENGAPDGTLVASNPEFLREGSAIRDFKIPDRIVIGAEDERAQHIMSEVYRPLFLNKAPILFTGRRTAELIKYAANAFLATKISFINEVADLCEAVGADVQEVSRGIGLDNRIGAKFLHAGPGYVEGKRVAVLGLTFKPNTDDMRDAPSLPLIRSLQEGGAAVAAFDPVGREQAEPLLSNIEFASDSYAAVKGADALVLVTEWDEFRALDLRRIAELMRGRAVLDLRNIYEPDEVVEAGLTYFGIGRGASANGSGATPQ